MKKQRYIAEIIAMVCFTLLLATPLSLAREQATQEEQYRADYNRYNKIKGVDDPMKRCDALDRFMRDRRNSKLLQYAQDDYLRILQGLHNRKDYEAMMPRADRFAKLFPNVGEVYYFQGLALREEGKLPEAMNSLAKCYVLRNRASQKAKQFLDHIYKGQNKGSLAGLEKIISKARAEVSS